MALSFALGFGASCKGKGTAEGQGQDSDPDAQSSAAPGDDLPQAEVLCPHDEIPIERAPGTPPELESLDAWLKITAAPPPAGLGLDLDQALLAAEQVAELNAQAAQIDGAWRPLTAPEIGDPARVAAQIDERVVWMNGQVVAGHYQEAVPGSFAAAKQRVVEAQPVDELRAVAAEASLRCMPLSIQQPLFKVDPKASPAKSDAKPDPDFDRNNCASLHAGEWVRVLRRAPSDEGTWVYVHAGHSVGWLLDPQLTPPVEAAAYSAKHALGAPGHVPVLALHDGVRTREGRALRLGAHVRHLPSPEAKAKAGKGYVAVEVPTVEGFVADAVPADQVRVGFAPLTRRLLLQWAFSELGAPYGWGGRAGERDCSRYLRDVFYGFGAQLARHSAVQAKHGPERIDVSGLDDVAKLEAIASAHRRGPVLLYMPGHIMLYLGQAPSADSSADGAPDEATSHFAISSISEVLAPCPVATDDDDVMRLDKVAVTDLDLGRGTARRAFVERITTLVVFGQAAD